MSNRVPPAGRALTIVVALTLLAMVPQAARAAESPGEPIGAGAAIVNISPTAFPVRISGGFLEARATQVGEPIYVRALVLDNGKTRIAIAVVDSCGVEARFLDQSKRLASQATGIPPENMLISATHTHSAPAAWAVLGTRVDPSYVELLVPQVARAITQAAAKVQPAQVGWAVVRAPDYTHNRRWILRQKFDDPFGSRNMRANMHPGHNNPEAISPSGPVDADLSMLAVQTTSGRPLAVLANFSQHYYGGAAISPDYFGHFCSHLAELVGVSDSQFPFVGIMSQGTSGDLQWMDYGEAKGKWRSRDEYAATLAEIAHGAWEKIEYHRQVPLAIAERKLTLGRRVPDAARLAWARPIVEKIQARPPEQRLPHDVEEVYAAEAVHLHNEPTVEIKLQAIRIGDLGIAALPNEVYAITGLKLKAQSALAHTFNISLANGAWGYIPPPEQHRLGGYTTWPARSAGLEELAEPKMVSALLEMLEELAGRPRRRFIDPESDYVHAVRSSKPVAFWRLGDIEGTVAMDSVGSQHGTYAPGVALYLEGAPAAGLGGGDRGNRAAHFAGGHLDASVGGLGNAYSVEMWFWNGLEEDWRAVTGFLVSLNSEGTQGSPSEGLAIGGNRAENEQGKLFFSNGKGAFRGTTQIPQKTWNHVALVRDGRQVTVYLNGDSTAEISAETQPVLGAGDKQILIGGDHQGLASFEGKLDEVAVYNRALSAAEISAHWQAAGSDAEQEQSEK
ncbi:MAG: hypothetical protein MK171_13490 [Pirellulales bacterium]|nr:hypothetical protein [Pirellulales bacterium]